MPCIEDWVSNPLSVVDGICKETSSKATESVRDFFARRVQDGGHRIPSINDTPLHNLKPNSLVKFRCMVQDMFGPEYFMSIYETVSNSTGETALQSGLYRDVIECSEGMEVNFESSKCVTSEKQTYYCVPIPAETEWAKRSFAERAHSVKHIVPPQQSTGCKRSLEDDEEMEQDSTNGNGLTGSAGGMEVTQTDEEAAAKKSRPGNENPTSTKPGPATVAPGLNFPLPGEKGPACLVHVYNNSDDIKLNDMIEFIGILSVDPSLAAMPSEKPDPTVLTPDDLMSQEEKSVHHPPPSLVPRLHCIVAQSLKHSNPAIPPELTEDALKVFQPEAQGIRADLLSMLTKLLYGDSLAAEFLLLHLVSSVYTRSGVMAVGKFALNLSSCPVQQSSEGKLPTQVSKFLEQILPKCFALPMSLSNLNTLNFAPKKDYNADRLTSGILQLTNGTELILDETAMEAGTLNVSGVQNITALGSLISWQKLAYDFNFYKKEFQADVQALVFSEGKSLLPSDCQVKLNPETAPATAETLLKSLTPEALNKIRTYLGVLRLAEYSVSQEMQKRLQEDFVNARQQVHGKMTADDFHLHLLLARLTSLSFGHASLSIDVWNRVKEMEVQRRGRLPAAEPTPP